MARQSRSFRITLALGAVSFLLTAATPALAADPAPQQSTTTTTTPAPAPEKHHSMTKGAVVGGVGGAVVGGKKGAVLGAGAGALIQHHKNKKAEKEAAQPQK